MKFEDCLDDSEHSDVTDAAGMLPNTGLKIVIVRKCLDAFEHRAKRQESTLKVKIQPGCC